MFFLDNLVFLYELLTTILPALLVFGLMRGHRSRHLLPAKRGFLLLLLVLAIYLGLMFMVTGSGTIYDFFRFGLSYSDKELNLIPFAFDTYPMQYVLNVIMFLPLGMLLPALWPSSNKLHYTLLYGFGLSLLIEISQLFNRRVSDVNDLIMNVLGAVIGYGIYRLYRSIKETRSQRRRIRQSQNAQHVLAQDDLLADPTDIDASAQNPQGFSLPEIPGRGGQVRRPESGAIPALYLGAMFFGHFFLYNGLGLVMLMS